MTISLESLVDLLNDLTEHEELLVDVPAYKHKLDYVKYKLDNGMAVTQAEAAEIQKIHGYMTGIQFAG